MGLPFFAHGLIPSRTSPTCLTCQSTGDDDGDGVGGFETYDASCGYDDGRVGPGPWRAELSTHRYPREQMAGEFLRPHPAL